MNDEEYPKLLPNWDTFHLNGRILNTLNEASVVDEVEFLRLKEPSSFTTVA